MQKVVIRIFTNLQRRRLRGSPGTPDVGPCVFGSVTRRGPRCLRRAQPANLPGGYWSFWGEAVRSKWCRRNARVYILSRFGEILFGSRLWSPLPPSSWCTRLSRGARCFYTRTPPQPLEKGRALTGWPTLLGTIIPSREYQEGNRHEKRKKKRPKKKIHFTSKVFSHWLCKKKYAEVVLNTFNSHKI